LRRKAVSLEKQTKETGRSEEELCLAGISNAPVSGNHVTPQPFGKLWVEWGGTVRYRSPMDPKNHGPVPTGRM